VSNLGGTFPRFFVLRLVDAFTSATCLPPSSGLDQSALKGPLVTQAFSCAIQADKERCLAGGGTCDMARDGYYIVNIICVAIGVTTFFMFIRPKVLQLQALPLRAWRLSPVGAAK
jgi:MFS transporter, PAT family, solute carrier family 33 (acetyl-CoA transportor), member 1